MTLTPSRIDELERLETLARAAQTSHKDNDDWYTWRSQMDRYHVAASPDVILALLAEMKRLREALGNIPLHHAAGCTFVLNEKDPLASKFDCCEECPDRIIREALEDAHE